MILCRLSLLLCHIPNLYVDLMFLKQPHQVLFLEYNAIPLHRELGLFIYDGNYLVRRIVYRKNKVVLKSDNLLTRDIVIEDNSKFTIIGRINVEN